LLFALSKFSTALVVACAPKDSAVIVVINNSYLKTMSIKGELK
jgi:hypothetical protein